MIEKLVCPICKERKMYYTGKRIVQLDDLAKKENRWLNTDYRVYKCLNVLDKCKGSKQDIHYVHYYKEQKLEKVKIPLSLYDGRSW